MFNWRQRSEGEPTRRLPATETAGEARWSQQPPTEPGYYVMVGKKGVAYEPKSFYTDWYNPRIIYVGHGGDLGLLYIKYSGQEKASEWSTLPAFDKFTFYCGPLPDVPR